MKTYQELSPGAKTVYFVPVSPKTKFAKVASVLVSLASQDEQSVTFTVAPTMGDSVEIFYGKDIVIPPGTRTVTGTGAPLPPPPTSGVALYLNVTAVSGTSPVLTVKIQCLDDVSGTWFDVLGAVFAAASAVSTQTLVVFPGALAVANVAVNRAIPNTYRAYYTITGTTPSFTFSIGAQS